MRFSRPTERANYKEIHCRCPDLNAVYLPGSSVVHHFISATANRSFPQLYSSDEPHQQIEEGTTERCSFPAITQREVEPVINQSKKGKAPGPDNITMDLLKDADTLVFKKLVILRIFTRVLTNRITKTLDENQPREQAGFRKGYSTIDHLHSGNQLIEKSVDIHKVLESIKNQNVEPVFADDFVLVANSLQDLQQMLNELSNESKKFRLKMNLKNTKLMHARQKDENFEVKMENYSIRVVDHYMYPGQRVTTDSSKEQEIKKRITLEWRAFGRASAVFKSEK
nr:uncharacterized protein LOC113818742 [Penaeus vannamei]